MRNDSAILTEDLTRRFGDFTAVDRISLDVPRGDIFGFLGPNGAGKTTTIRMLLGLLSPSDGTGHVLGYDIASQVHQIQQNTGYMSQRFSLYGDLTVWENLDFYGSTYGLRGRDLQRRIEEALEITELTAQRDQLTGTLAGGFRKRVALASAILHRPEVLFLDEPTAGVDPISRREFWHHLYELAEAGHTIFVTTHYMDEAENCRHLGLIHNGKLILQGSPTAIKKDLKEQVLEVACDKPDVAMKALREADLPTDELALYGASIHVIAPDADQWRARIKEIMKQADVTIRSLETITPSLEDVFITSIRNQKESS